MDIQDPDTLEKANSKDKKPRLLENRIEDD
jgi:hypothetical protein